MSFIFIETKYIFKIINIQLKWNLKNKQLKLVVINTQLYVVGV